MAENAPVDLLANAMVTGPNVLPLDPSAAPAMPAAPVAEPDETPDAPAAPEPAPTPASEPEAEPAPAASSGEDEPPPKPTGQQRLNMRFSELTQQRDLAKQEAEYWKQRALESPAPSPQPPAQPPAQPQAQPQQPQEMFARAANGRPLRPQAEHYTTTQAYDAAMDAYTEALSTFAVQTALAQQEQRQAALSHRERQNARLTALREAHPDFDTVMAAPTFRVSQVVGQAMIASEYYHDLAYHLEQHPDEAARLSSLDVPSAYLAIGELQARLRTTPANGAAAPAGATTTVPPPEPPQQMSQAPAPIAPTNGRGAPATRSYDDVSLHEFITRRNKEEQAARR